MAVDYVKQTVKSGIAPLEIEYYPLRTLSLKEQKGLRSVLKVNSVDLGVLYPKHYRLVTNRNAQCIRLAKWAFKQIVSDIDTMAENEKLPQYISFYVPAKMFVRGEFEKMLETTVKSGFEYAHKLCLEFSSDILLEDTAKTAALMKHLHEKYGLRFMLSEYGDEFCPVMRINGLPFNTVVLDETLCYENDFEDQSIKALIKLLRDYGITPILGLFDTEPVLEKAANAGCALYVNKAGLTLGGVLGNG